MARPSIHCRGVNEDEPIQIRTVWQTEQLALRFVGYLQELEIPATMREHRELPIVEMEIQKRHLDNVNFCLYLMEEWTRA
jgi:hypothetical protein